MQKFTTLQVNIQDKVAEVTLCRPEKANALNEVLWSELGQCMMMADQTADIRVVLITGAGANFCAGIDLEFLQAIHQRIHAEASGKRQESLRAIITNLQTAISSCEQCRKPVIAAIDGACYGGGIDLITACDLRYATEKARFCVKELDLAIVADVGTLQRLPRIIGEGRAREWILTAHIYNAQQALADGLLTKVVQDKQELEVFARSQARLIAQKSPLAVRGTKRILNYSRDHSVSEGLDFVASWNAAMLMSADLEEVIAALSAKRQPLFAD